MNNMLTRILCALSLLLAVNTAVAAITGASVTPLQAQLNATRSNSVAVSWRVTTDAFHRAGATSTNASFINADNNQVLGTTGGNFSTTGAGPIIFNETVVVSSAQVLSWQGQGIGRVLLRRVFNDPGSGATATATATLLVPARTNLSGAQASPRQLQVSANRVNEFTVNWQVPDTGSAAGITSAMATIINPLNGGTLAQVGGTLTSTGSGPHLLTETVTLSPAQVQTWLSQGLRRIALNRVFTDSLSGSSTSASMTLMLTSSNLSAARDNPTGALAIQALKLEFDSGNNLAVAKQREELTAKLSIVHSGNGVLEGRWQVAEPGSTEGVPVFRTLALVRKNLFSSQRSYLASPVLPTHRSGKFLLRFCVTNRDMLPDGGLSASQCPIDNLIVDASYQVEGADRHFVSLIQGLSPNRQEVTKVTEFRWKPLATATVYQLQIFSMGTRSEVTVGNDSPRSELVEPEFVTGMVLPAATVTTPLSDLVRSKLTSNHRYMWRIMAHDKSGQLVGSSDEASFVYKGAP